MSEIRSENSETIAAQAVALAAGEAHHHQRIVPQSPRPGSCEHNRNRGGGFTAWLGLYYLNQTRIVLMRQAAHVRLRNAVDHWARVAVQHDLRSQAKYAALRARGHGHGRALPSVGDRLIGVACALLGAQTPFRPNPSHERALNLGKSTC